MTLLTRPNRLSVRFLFPEADKLSGQAEVRAVRLYKHCVIIAQTITQARIIPR